jgi:hypothetical protein
MGRADAADRREAAPPTMLDCVARRNQLTSAVLSPARRGGAAPSLRSIPQIKGRSRRHDRVRHGHGSHCTLRGLFIVAQDAESANPKNAAGVDAYEQFIAQVYAVARFDARRLRALLPAVTEPQVLTQALDVIAAGPCRQMVEARLEQLTKSARPRTATPAGNGPQRNWT